MPLFYFICLLLFSTQVLLAQTSKLYPIHTGNLWGLVDQAGQLQVAPTYDYISSFQDGYAVAKKAQQVGILDQKGALVIPCHYTLIEPMGRGLFSVKVADDWKIINVKEEVVFEKMVAKITWLGGNYMMFEGGEGKGLAHLYRGVLMEAEYDHVELIGSGLVAAYNNAFEHQLFDTLGHAFLPTLFKASKVIGDWVWARKGKNWGAYDRTGKQILKHEWLDYLYINENFISLKKGTGRALLYNVQQQKMAYQKEARFVTFGNGYLKLVEPSGRMGLLNPSGNLIVDPVYDSLMLFNDQQLLLQQNGKWALSDTFYRPISAFKYDYIWPSNSSITRVVLNKKFGVLNIKGKEVLPPVYDRFLSIDGQVVRYRKGNDKGAHLWTFDEEGELLSNTKFANLKSIRLRSRGSVSSSTRSSIGGPAQQLRILNDSLAWKYDRSAGQWGLWHRKRERYKFPPQWNSILMIPEIGLTIVGMSRQDIGGRQPIGRIQLRFHQVFGLFNNQHGLPISRMHFLDIRVTDFTQKNLPLARCTFVGGKHGLVSRSGRVIAKDYAYIGEFQDGKARASQKGKIVVDLNERIDRFLEDAPDYYGAWRSRYTFDEDDNPKFFVDFRKKGRLYCKDGVWGYIDTLGQVHTDFQYAFAENYVNGCAMVRQPTGWGMLDSLGNEIIKPQYDDFDTLANSAQQLFYIAEKQPLYGMVNTEASLVIPTNYLQIKTYQDGLVAVQDRSGRWGFIDLVGKVVIAPKYKAVRDFHEGRAVVYYKSRWGVIDRQGQVIVPFEYSRIGTFSEGKAWVQLKNGHKGYINLQGELLFEGPYQKLGNFKQGVASFLMAKKGWGLLNAKGEVIFKPQRRVRSPYQFNELGVAIVKVGKKYRLLSHRGEWASKQSYDYIRAFSDSVAIVRLAGKEGRYGFIDTTGELVVGKTFKKLQDFSSGRAVYLSEKNRKMGCINKQGQVVIQPAYSRIYNFEGNRAIAVEAYSKVGVIDTAGQLIIPCQHKKIMAVEDGLALVRRYMNAFYFVHEDNKRHSPYAFQKAHPFSDGVAPFCLRNKWGLIDKKGLQVLTPKYADMTPFEAGMSKVKVQRLIGVVDSKGAVIIPPEYEYITYVGDGLFRVERGDKMGYLDRSGNWIWPMQL